MNIGEAFRKARKRLLFLDYDGTLVPFARHPQLASPNQQLLHLLTLLARQPGTEVTIISGRDSATLEQWFKDVPVNLVAEHGASVRMHGGEWHHEKEIDQSWKPWIRPTLELFTHRSPGSFIEEKRHTLAWHYRNVNPELGFTRSRELLDSLNHLIHNAYLQIIDGNKVIEVRVAGIDKGTVASKFVEGMDYDFIMAIGDDKTDEDMFRALADKAITIKIGSGHTLAKYSLATQAEVIQLLNELVADASGPSL